MFASTFNTQWLNAGGPVMAILGVMSVIALALVLLKLWQFWMLRIGNVKFVEPCIQQWRAGDVQNALNRLSSTPNPIARVMEVVLYGHQENLPESQVREESQRVAMYWLADSRRYLRGLEVIATLSPLLGLLGTVLGMIEAFQALEQAGSRADPSVLSGGIWEALLTTAAGLSVAIPTVAALNWLEQAVDNLRVGIEDTTTRLFTGGENIGVGTNPVVATTAQV